jgi:iduronate 2-sulfatase
VIGYTASFPLKSDLLLVDIKYQLAISSVTAQNVTMHCRSRLPALLLLAAAVAQPPINPNELLIGDDLPGMPIAITTLNGDGQFCAFACMADAKCRGYNYVPDGCDALSCPYKGGCCWLKPVVSSLDSKSSKCGGSFIMRPDPASLPPVPTPAPLPPGVKNVLYVVVDDLRPDISPYGANWMVTPNVQSIAQAGTTFTRAYCQIAVCSPSRMSFLTGRYPYRTLTWNFVNHFRQATCREVTDTSLGDESSAYTSLEVGYGGAAQCCSFCTADANCKAWTIRSSNCTLYKRSNGAGTHEKAAISGLTGTTATRDWISLPQHFTNAGYLTLSSGKIFHTEEGGSGPAPWDGEGTGMPPLQDPLSWTRGNTSLANVNSIAPMRPCNVGSCSINAAKNGDVPDGTFQFCDRLIGDDAVVKLTNAATNFKTTGQPFFMAVGFRKPHLPFRHPAPWDDDYPTPTDIPLAEYKTLGAATPPIAFHQTSLAVNPYIPMKDLDAGTYRRDYYAAASFMDWNLGRVLKTLQESGLQNDTLIVFHSDHGWSLGEHGEWEKFTNFEHGTRIPLIISAPWLPAPQGGNISAPVELIDVFPTIAELAGIPVPSTYNLDGVSLAPLLATQRYEDGDGNDVGVKNLEASGALRNYSFSMYPRCPADLTNASNFWADNDCMMTERSRIPFMGLSLRVAGWRYTEWLKWNGSSLSPHLDSIPVGVELYNHTADTGLTFDGPWEQFNLAGDPGVANIQSALAAQLRQVYPAGSAWPSTTL